MAIPYMEEVGLGDQIYEMMKARNLDEMKQALGRLQLMAQNVMVGTVQGDIYYLRNGRVPIRPPGVDPSRPIPGHTSANEWQGIHPLVRPGPDHEPARRLDAELQLLARRDDDRQPDGPREVRGSPVPLQRRSPSATHQRAQMMNELLDAADKVTVEQAIDIAFNPQVYHAEKWQARVERGLVQRPATPAKSGDAAEVFRQIEGWNRRCDPDSAGALAYYAFKRALGKELGSTGRAPRRAEGRPDRRGPASGRRVAAVQLRLGRGPVRPLLPRGSRGGRSVLAGRRRLAAEIRRWPRRAPSASTRHPTASR